MHCITRTLDQKYLRPLFFGFIYVYLTEFKVREFEGGIVMNSGDTAFIIVSAALVFFMTPGLAFSMEALYGGKM